MKTVRGKVETKYKNLLLPEHYLIVDTEEYAFTNRTIDVNNMLCNYVHLTCIVDGNEVIKVVGN